MTAGAREPATALEAAIEALLGTPRPSLAGGTVEQVKEWELAAQRLRVAYRAHRGEVTMCPVPSSVTGQPCLLPDGHRQDSGMRFHRYAAPEAAALAAPRDAGEGERLAAVRAEIARRRSPGYRRFEKPSQSQTPTERVGSAAVRAQQHGELIGLVLAERLIAAAPPEQRVGLGDRALAAVVEWSRRYAGTFSYTDQHEFVRAHFDPIAALARQETGDAAEAYRKAQRDLGYVGHEEEPNGL